jgi:hypothetical protein
MRRLIPVLAAVLLAAGTVLTTAGAARVGGTAPHRASCMKEKVFLTVTEGSIRYFVGAPNHLLPGASALLKPKRNDTTILTACAFPASKCDPPREPRADPDQQGLLPSGDVTVTPTGNGGNGFTSQLWDFVNVGTSSATFQNAKTGLFLRVRNNGPIMGQTVTTGRAATAWTFSRHQI